MRIRQPPRHRQGNLRECSVASRPRVTGTGSSGLDSPCALPPPRSCRCRVRKRQFGNASFLSVPWPSYAAVDRKADFVRSFPAVMDGLKSPVK